MGGKNSSFALIAPPGTGALVGAGFLLPLVVHVDRLHDEALHHLEVLKNKHVRLLYGELIYATMKSLRMAISTTSGESTWEA